MRSQCVSECDKDGDGEAGGDGGCGKDDCDAGDLPFEFLSGLVHFYLAHAGDFGSIVRFPGVELDEFDGGEDFGHEMNPLGDEVGEFAVAIGCGDGEGILDWEEKENNQSKRCQSRNANQQQSQRQEYFALM